MNHWPFAHAHLSKVIRGEYLHWLARMVLDCTKKAKREISNSYRSGSQLGPSGHEVGALENGERGTEAMESVQC
jgi:hypothetical protein